MPHLTLAGLSDDGKRLLLVSDNGDEHTLDIDARLRAALRGEHARIGQLEIHMDSALRPRDIQARIRAGEDPESVAQAAQTTVDRIMPFAAPVLAERAHIAGRAQQASVRRRSGDTGARTLGEAVEAQLRQHSAPPESVDWDAWRRDDGRWTLTGAFTAGKRTGTATFVYDARGNFVTMEDDEARWLVGESPAGGAARGGEGRRSARRLSAVPAEELPLGEDAIELVSDPEDGDEAASSPAETTLDLGEGLGSERPVEAYLPGEHGEAPEADTEPADADDGAATDSDADADTESDGDEDRRTEPSQPDTGAVDPETDEPPARPPRRAARKTRGRASVPSWDEIMFGGPSEKG